MNKILLLCTFLSLNLHASEGTQFGRVVELQGAGFISFNGKTREIKKGDSIEVGSEIVIEHHGQVTFTDNADHRFHLGNASSAAVGAQYVELRAGDLWFQSLNKTDDYKVKTVNAVINYQGGEGIVSYDSAKGKTQLMVINSMMNIANLRSPELNLSVSEGHFSFIDNAYDEGAPRDPTPVGEKTYKELVSLFTGISPMDKNSVAVFKSHENHEEKVTEHKVITKKEHGARAIASVPEADATKSGKKEDHIKMMEEYKNNLLNPKKTVTNKTAATKMSLEGKKNTKAEKIVVHIYGQTSKPTIAFTFDTLNNYTATTTKVTPAASVAESKVDATPESKTDTKVETKSRAPASVLDQEVPNDTAKEQRAPTPAAAAAPYSKMFKNQYKESDKLINDLKKL